MIGKKVQFNSSTGFALLEITKEGPDEKSYWAEVIHTDEINFPIGFNMVIYKDDVGTLWEEPSIDTKAFNAKNTIYDLENAIRNASENEREWFITEINKIILEVQYK